MCGIVGWLTDSQQDQLEKKRQFELMYTKIRTRGPDASGFWSDPFSGISLGHSRLSIIDLTEEGSQPMASPSGRYMVSYNGEIYNHNQLRRLLVEGKKFQIGEVPQILKPYLLALMFLVLRKL